MNSVNTTIKKCKITVILEGYDNNICCLVWKFFTNGFIRSVWNFIRNVACRIA